MEDERRVAAYIAAVRARDVLKDEPSLGGLLDAATVKHTLTSDPPGVRVSVREIDPAAEWQYIGETPLSDVRLPRGTARWRFEKTGYETLERTNGGPMDSLLGSVGTFERNDGRMSTWPEPSRAFRDWAMRQVSDLRRTIDYIETRGDLRRDAIGYLGSSWGARKGAIALALDSRIRAGVFLSGGLSLGDVPPELDPSNFAPRVSVPVLMINGDEDFIFPLESSQKPLFQALGTAAPHKRHLVLPAGHAVQFEHRNRTIREVLDWLDRYLK